MNDTYKIEVYRFTGNQGIFSVSKKWCEECDMVILLVKNVVKDLKLKNVKYKIRPWFLWFWLPFLKYLAWHAPILVINGTLISQGIVPSRQKIIKHLKKNSNYEK